jgi:type IV secretory pathway VirB4 component
VALTAGLAPKLGEHHLRIVTVRGFPNSTWPDLLDELNRLGFAYRWVTRFVFLDKADAERELTKLRRQWFAKRKGIVTLLRETVFQQESPLVDSDAANKATDADAALQELGSDAVGFGYVTATIVVSDPDATAADEKRKAVERAIQGRGFVAVVETLECGGGVALLASRTRLRQRPPGARVDAEPGALNPAFRCVGGTRAE